MHQVFAAIAMGFAIAGMHYAGMQAANFTMLANESGSPSSNVSPSLIAVFISTVTFLILLIALVAATLERIFQQMARREARAALRLEVADLLRTKGAQALEDVASLTRWLRSLASCVIIECLQLGAILSLKLAPLKVSFGQLSCQKRSGRKPQHSRHWHCLS